MNGQGLNLGIIQVIIAIQAFIFNGGKNQIMIVISLEQILQGIGIAQVNISFNLDDQIGSNLTLYLLPLAGAESAVAQALQVAYYPQRGSITLK